MLKTTNIVLYLLNVIIFSFLTYTNILLISTKIVFLFIFSLIFFVILIKYLILIILSTISLYKYLVKDDINELEKLKILNYILILLSTLFIINSFITSFDLKVFIASTTILLISTYGVYINHKALKLRK